MKNKSVPFLKLTPLPPDVKSVVERVLEKGIFINGDHVEKFCDAFSTYLNITHVVPTANCTHALEMILLNLGIGKGDEVITSAFSWVSDASVIRLVGAKPVFCDIDLRHFGIDDEELMKKISFNTKAIILPHLFGLVHPAIEKIANICKQRSIILIEDCAQAHGATIDSKGAGSFGDVAAFSFYPTKNLGALGDAGAIATNRETLARDCRYWANHGQITRNKHESLGSNSRMDEIQAAILLAKLPFLDADNARRRRLAQIYFDELKSLDVVLPSAVEGHVYHQFVIQTEKRNELKMFLKARAVETDIHYPTALPEMPIFNSQSEYPTAVWASETVLSLPIHPNHSEEDILFVAKLIRAFFKV